MRCPDDSRIAEYLGDVLSQDERAEVEDHIDGCPECRELVAEVIKTTTVSEETLTPFESPAAGPTFRPGQEVDDFDVISLLAWGGMGELYLAGDRRLGRQVALKTIRGQSRDTHRSLDQLMEEARATAAIVHPNVVTLFSAGEHSGVPYMALEYIDGPNLRAWLAEKPRSQEQLLRTVVQIARGLQAAHGRSVAHLDLKPENVLIDGMGMARVADFGFARFTKDRARKLSRSFRASDGDTGGVVAGTPAYMAPEQWLGGDASEATDIWALGVLAHELLVGERPYKPEEESLSTLGAAVTAATPVPSVAGLASLPKAPARVIDGCLRKDPADRMELREVIAALDGTLAPRTPRSMWLAVAGILLFLAATTPLAILWLGGASAGELPPPVPPPVLTAVDGAAATDSAVARPDAPHKVELQVAVEPLGAELRIAGRPEPAPYSGQHYASSTVVVEVNKEGWQPIRREVRLQSKTTLTIRLEPAVEPAHPSGKTTVGPRGKRPGKKTSYGVELPEPDQPYGREI